MGQMSNSELDFDHNDPYAYWIYDFEKNDLIPKFWHSASFNSDDILVSYSNGAFTTFRTRNKSNAFQLSLHLERLEESMRLAGYEFPFNRDQIRLPLRALLAQQSGQQHRVRLQIPFESINLCVIIIEQFHPYDQSYYSKGVIVKTNHLIRQNPQAKLTSFTRKAAQEKNLIKKLGIEESIILNGDNQLLEGLSSNFFAIKNDSLFTANEGVLFGITRKMILEIVEGIDIKVIADPVKYSELENVQETFISSTSRLVMPVVRIDKNIIGNGKPGEMTIKILDLFKVRFDQEFEPI